jgi:hypothetical protein
MTELSNPAYAAIASMVAAFIVAMSNHVNMAISKDQEIARWRAQWIKNVTTALATLCAEVELLVRLVECGTYPQGLDNDELQKLRSKNKDHYKNLNEAFCAARLQLHPKQNDKILDQLNLLYDAFYTPAPSCANLNEIHIIQKELIKMSQCLHNEIWEKIKSGEDLFVFIRTLTFALGALALVVICVVLYLHLF